MGVSVSTLSIHLRLSLNGMYSVREKGKTDGAANGTYYAAYVFPPPLHVVALLIWLQICLL